MSSTSVPADLEKAGAYWSTKKPDLAKSRWWTNARILRHINRIVCGEALEGISSGTAALMRRMAGPLENGVSIGCGDGSKEMSLVTQGLVQHFRLYELAEDRVARGRKMAEARGIADRVTFVQGDGFEEIRSEVDLVYWNNALHHMMDTDAAVQWSRNVLRAGGWFVMDDFVGPTRFQWTDINLEMANRMRASLPDRFFAGDFPRSAGRPDPERLRAVDPTEAADSDRILPSVNKHFPGARIIHTGGCIYHIGLNGILANFTEDDAPLLDALLLLDESMARSGETHYAVAISQR